MKKILFLLITSVFIVSCFGCSKTPKVTTPITTEPTNEITAEPTVEPSSEVVSEEETQPSTEPPTENPGEEPTQELTTVAPTEQATTQKPTEKPTEKPTTKPNVQEESKHSHSYKPKTTKPTCTESGYITYSCECGDSYSEEYIDATGHSCSSVVTKPTCTEQGYTTYSCKNCNYQYVDNYVNAKGHTEVIDPAVAATYTSTGLTEGKHCSVCNTILIAQQETPKSNIETFDNSNIVIKFAEISSYTYSHGEYSIYCDYKISTTSCTPKKATTYIDHNHYTSYGTRVSFTFSVRVQACTGVRYMNIPYVITNSKGEVLKDYYDGYSNLGRFNAQYSETASYTKGSYYTLTDTIYFPAVPETYTITFLNPYTE